MQIRTCSIPHVKSWPFDQSEQFSQKDKHNIINITTCIWNKEKSENCKHALKKKYIYLKPKFNIYVNSIKKRNIYGTFNHLTMMSTMLSSSLYPSTHPFLSRSLSPLCSLNCTCNYYYAFIKEPIISSSSNLCFCFYLHIYWFGRKR